MSINLIGLQQSFDGLASVQITADYCRIDLHQPMTCFSNAPWRGGMQTGIQGILNLKVAKDAKPDPLTGEHEPLEHTFPRVVQELTMTMNSVGMMTAASMKSFRFHFETIQEYALLICVTSGLDNARRVGDPADDPGLHLTNTSGTPPLPAGTINMMMVTNAPLSQAAAIEAIALLTEAKTAACYDLGVPSRKLPFPNTEHTAKLATGTGTDATLVAIPQEHEGSAILYCGKHTLLGEKIGAGSYRILTDTLQACLGS